MSKANGAIEKKDTFLQHVSLKNYKSIKDVEIDFKPGLNIIIGKNGVGKTNFIKALNNVLNAKYKELPNSESQIKISINNEVFTLESKFTGDNKMVNSRTFRLDNHEETKDYHEIEKQIEKTKSFYKSNLITHGIPYNNTKFLQIPGSLTITSNGAISGEIINFSDSETIFIKQYFSGLFSDIAVYMGDYKPLDKDYIKDKINNSNHIFKFLNPILKFYSPISEIQINPDFRIENNNFNNEIILTNFSFQFKVFNNWQPFDFLSDGTKRLFYVISEIVGLNFRHERAFPENSNFDIVFIEEPELGIHPHQLHQLMQFIKEQSREKQIIITTHSPQVLDTIGSDELDRIIICEYDGKNGTQLRHLTEKETNKAKNYMEDAFLSDYWRFSDLEPVS